VSHALEAAMDMVHLLMAAGKKKQSYWRKKNSPVTDMFIKNLN
jgi:hypothetical protein